MVALNSCNCLLGATISLLLLLNLLLSVGAIYILRQKPYMIWVQGEQMPKSLILSHTV